ncbi:MAG: hypothetical protein GAK29_01440 [Acinetobacter bereziniae]|uniref:Uncharacterized protein n=1 Tax=Acinetobacter bereziniae TaxID=106648 RepID=A0A833PFD5_ACIBZ|nr:MAG: hypothetical protein GAK29_01440 [Acinetobacter bereziniae]
MTKFRNLKIAITEDQLLDDVMMELERIGYKISYKTIAPVRCVIFDNCHYSLLGSDIDLVDNYELTTLAELKEMEND